MPKQSKLIGKKDKIELKVSFVRYIFSKVFYTNKRKLNLGTFSINYSETVKTI